MWIFRHKQRIPDPREIEIQALKKSMLNKIDRATQTTKLLNDKLEKDGGVTYRIFLATGGDRRK